MSASKHKVTILPPKLHKFSTSGASVDRNFDSIWEIGVPEKNSLPWSVVLAYLYLSNDLDLNKFLKRVAGDETEIEEIKQKKNLKSKLNVETIKKQLKSFNPFKNRHVFFYQANEIIDLFRIFDLRVKRQGNKLKEKNDEWNDEFKLNAASLLLECEIEVHFPNDTDQKIVTYPKSRKTFNSKIILFQYENQQHGSRLTCINIFRFGMTVEQANPRKLDALNHILSKTKIPRESITKIKELAKNPKYHGKFFLAAVLKNRCGDILPETYKSPYIALKISEAGFETDPLASSSEILSVFGYSVLFGEGSKYLSIMYDYASNCHYLFGDSIRKASDNILKILKQIKSLLEKDVLELSNSKKVKHFGDTKETVTILKQFITYADYQITVSSELNNLKKSFESSRRTEKNTFEFRKSVIEIILMHYQNYFYYQLDSPLRLPASISEKFSNYTNFSDYYKNADSFGCIIFFDNFYQLRLLIGLKQENMFLNIEWKLFLSILFNNYFPQYDHESKANVTIGEIKCQKTNVLRYVPLLYRNVLPTDISQFLKTLKDTSDSGTLKKILKPKESINEFNGLPMIIDVLLKIRLEQHIKAALEVPVDDSKSILAIERVLQIIGESVKPPSSGVISFFLRSCLAYDLQKHLIFIRNNLSHKRGNSICGRLQIEQDLCWIRKMQKEIAQIKDRFEIVFFTQFFRIEESAMISCIKTIENEVGQDVTETFYNEYSLCIDERVQKYDKVHDKCVKLLFDTLSDMQNHIEKSKKELMSQLKAINYLLEFILKHTNSVNILKNFNLAVDLFVLDSGNKEEEFFKNDLRTFLLKWIDVLKQNNIIGQYPLASPTIGTFAGLLKSDLFSTDEKNQIKFSILSAYDEAIDANNKLKNLLSKNSNESQKLEILLKQIFILPSKKIILSNYCNSKSKDGALKLLKGERLSKIQLEKDIQELFQPADGLSAYFTILLTKITYQKYLSAQIYTSVKISGNIQQKLEFFLTKTARMLITKIKSLKNILIDEDEEIKQTWIWGKSKEIKHHMKFLMRQRYMKDITVRASLDMAFFDCVNILQKDSLSDLYEKSTNLFSGINLRNILSHGATIPETIGGILDEDDFPSTMIEKILELIDDLEAIETILELFPKVGILEEIDFINWVKSTSDDQYKKQIMDCKKWDKYLFLFPFIRN